MTIWKQTSAVVAVLPSRCSTSGANVSASQPTRTPRVAPMAAGTDMPSACARSLSRCRAGSETTVPGGEGHFQRDDTHRLQHESPVESLAGRAFQRTTRGPGGEAKPDDIRALKLRNRHSLSSRLRAKANVFFDKDHLY